MQITQKQYEKIAKYLPRQRGNVSMSNLQLINAILYVTENGCKWRTLPETYGNWHTIYVRMNRWSKNGVLSRVFAALKQKESSRSMWRWYALTARLSRFIRMEPAL